MKYCHNTHTCFLPKQRHGALGTEDRVAVLEGITLVLQLETRVLIVLCLLAQGESRTTVVSSCEAADLCAVF